MTARPRKPLLVNLAWAVVALVLLYVVSVGPACWMTSQVSGPYSGVAPTPNPVMRVYFPLGRMTRDMESIPGPWLRWWMRLGVKDGEEVVIPTTFSDEEVLTLE